MKVKVQLVFEDWINPRAPFPERSIYNTDLGVALRSVDFHSGTTFDALIELDEENIEDLEFALDNGIKPVFYISKTGTINAQ